MTITLAEIVNSSFGSLAHKYGLRQKNQADDGDTYSVEYEAKHFVIRLEKYRVEIYTTIYKIDNPDIEINLFNLLTYLAPPKDEIPTAEYYKDETDDEKCYKKQLTHIATVLDNYWEAIDDFFSTGDYSSKVAKLREFMVRKHPELFKTHQK
jgi:hypothetical protein